MLQCLPVTVLVTMEFKQSGLHCNALLCFWLSCGLSCIESKLSELDGRYEQFACSDGPRPLLCMRTFKKQLFDEEVCDQLIQDGVSEAVWAVNGGGQILEEVYISEGGFINHTAQFPRFGFA